MWPVFTFFLPFSFDCIYLLLSRLIPSAAASLLLYASIIPRTFPPPATSLRGQKYRKKWREKMPLLSLSLFLTSKVFPLGRRRQHHSRREGMRW